MKLSFSTLACPEYSFSDIYAMAADLGFDGIEMRGLGREFFDNRRNMPFAKENIAETAKMLSGLGLEISCMSSDCCLRYSVQMQRNPHQNMKGSRQSDALQLLPANPPYFHNADRM